MSRVYIASSWRNEQQPEVVRIFKQHGHDVYDFRDEKTGSFVFHWTQVDPCWESWSAEFFSTHLDHELCKQGFCADFGGMAWADVCVLLLPCGRSAHLEAGWFVGQGKQLHIVLDEKPEPELMYRMATGIWTSAGTLAKALNK